LQKDLDRERSNSATKSAERSPQPATLDPQHRLLKVGPKDFERQNDKNFSPKKPRRIEW